jgi:hypothetical protein
MEGHSTLGTTDGDSAEMTDVQNVAADKIQHPTKSSVELEFERVGREFLSHLTTTEVEEFQSVTIDDIRSSIVNIQEQHAERRILGNFGRIRRFLEVSESLGKVARVFGSASTHLSLFWAPTKFILQVSNQMVLNRLIMT